MRDCVEGDNPVKVFSILTGMSYTAIEESKSEEIEVGLYQATAFVFNQPQTFRDEPLPKSIKLSGKTILIPTKLESMTVGQNFQIRAEMVRAKNLESLISLACAIYLQPIVDQSKFDFNRAKELEAEILELNIYDIFPIGFFLLKRLNNSGQGGLLYSLQKRLNNLKMMLSWRPRLAFMSWSLCMILLSLIGMHNTTGSFRESCSKSRSMSLCHSFYCGNVKVNFNIGYHYLKT